MGEGDKIDMLVENPTKEQINPDQTIKDTGTTLFYYVIGAIAFWMYMKRDKH